MKKCLELKPRVMEPFSDKEVTLAGEPNHNKTKSLVTQALSHIIWLYETHIHRFSLFVLG